MLGAWGERFEEALVGRDASAAGRRAARDTKRTESSPQRLIDALQTREATIDRVFFDWRGGRDPGAELYPSESFRALAPLLEGWERARTHPYWSDAAPCSMHIDEVEAIWSAIAERDDWQPIGDKVEAVRRMGEAMTVRCTDSLTSKRRVVKPPAWRTYWSRPSRRPARKSGPARSAIADAEVDAARAAGRHGRRIGRYRIEAVRRFANVVRKRENEFAELISRETGKPLWEARTEVEAVVNKVEISIEAYAERTPQRKLEAALGNRIAVRHKPHGVLAVLGPYNFPAHLPNGHIVPALIAGNAVVFKPSEKTPATGEFLVRLLPRGEAFRKASSGC